MYYNPELKTDEISFNGKTWEEWQKTGRDNHSIYADPLFLNPEKNDFRLHENSPAFKLGFRPIDISQVGLAGAVAGPYTH